MPEPRLTICVPTYNRPERCRAAIQSALGQSLPARVLVSDDGDDDETERMLREYADNPLVTYLRSPAKSAWANWRFAMQAAIERGAEFVQILQDDDLLADTTARRIVKSFDAYPAASVYCAPLQLAYDNRLGFRHAGNWGPTLPCDVLRGQPTVFSGKLLTPIAYFSSWAMAPGKAFRVCEEFVKLLDDLPDGCDMYTERLDIATAGSYGLAIHDPKPAGLWIQHGSNLSGVQNADPVEAESQVAVAFKHIDKLMDQTPTWREEIFSWLGALGPQGNVVHEAWKSLKPNVGKSKYADEIFSIFGDLCRASGIPLDEA